MKTQQINDIRLPLGSGMDELKNAAAKVMGIAPSKIKHFKILRKSVDARKKNDIRLVYSVYASDTAPYLSPSFEYPQLNSAERPIIAGFGPAGMFCALVLAKAGLCPIVLEKGSSVELRSKKVAEFWRGSRLDTSTNVQFGEGGAGTFSDGKLTTQINDALCAEVLHTFAAFGAPEQILYLAKPHIGTDKLPQVVKNLRNRVIELGGEVHFDCALEDFTRADNGKIRIAAGGKTFVTDRLILATGHSARDIYQKLHDKKLPIAAKAFAVGVRIEHLQSTVDSAQYGGYAGHSDLPSAEYRLVYRGGENAYTFCMCPGGYVVASSSEENTVVTNGMSAYSRNGKNANSALLVGVNPASLGNGPLSGISFQQKLERAAFEIGGGNYAAPAQTVKDFLNGSVSAGWGAVLPTYAPAVTPARIDLLLPKNITETIKLAICDMGKKLKGFDAPDSLLTAPETRTSSPVRVLRDESGRQSSGFKGLYPCGEGCGYAGGIMSAAVDGLKTARAILMELGGKNILSS